MIDPRQGSYSIVVLVEGTMRGRTRISQYVPLPTGEFLQYLIVIPL